MSQGMERIHYWRQRIRDTAHHLQAAYETELPVGTLVRYGYSGGQQHEVEIKRHLGGNRVRVRSTETGANFVIIYDVIVNIVRKPENVSHH